MPRFRPNRGERHIRAEISDEEWFALQELKARSGCTTWTEFVKRLIKYRDIIARVLQERTIPP